MKAKNFYMVLKYTGEFDDMVKRINKSGVRPVPMDNLGLAYRHIFFLLEDPMDFPKAMPEHSAQGLAAIRIPERAFEGLAGRKTDYVEGSGIVKRLVDFVNEDDNLHVSRYKKIRIS